MQCAGRNCSRCETPLASLSCFVGMLLPQTVALLRTLGHGGAPVYLQAAAADVRPHCPYRGHLQVGRPKLPRQLCGWFGQLALLVQPVQLSLGWHCVAAQHL